MDHKETAEKIVRDAFDGWFGEPIESMEDEDRVRKYFFNPLVRGIEAALQDKFNLGFRAAGGTVHALSSSVDGSKT